MENSWGEGMMGEINVKYKKDKSCISDMKWVKQNLFLVLLLTFVLSNIVSVSALDSLGCYKQGDVVTIAQVCADATYVNISSISLPNSTTVSTNALMALTGSGGYSYDFNTSSLGRYDVRGISNGCDKTFTYYFYVSKTGVCYDNSQGLLILGEIGIMGLLIAIAFSFSKEKWKVRTAFFMFALFVGVITLNSIRLAVSINESLYAMANVMLILGIVILSFMFMYMLIYYTIEVFNYFKKKRRDKWAVSEDPN